MLTYTEAVFDDLVLDDQNVRRIYRNIIDLAETIESVGLLQNFVVMRLPEGKLLVRAGNRRYKAIEWLIRMDRWDKDRKIPIAIIVNPENEDAVFEQLIENIQREDISQWEAGARFCEIMDATGLTQAEIGERVRKSQGHVSFCMRAHRYIHPNVIEKLNRIGPNIILRSQLLKFCTMLTPLEEPNEKKQLEYLEQILKPRKPRRERKYWKTSSLRDQVFRRYQKLKAMRTGRYTDDEHLIIRNMLAYLEGTVNKLKIGPVD